MARQILRLRRRCPRGSWLRRRAPASDFELGAEVTGHPDPWVVAGAPPIDHPVRDRRLAAEGRGHAWDHVRNAAAEALMGTSDTAGLWTQVTSRIPEQPPVWWETFEREIRALLGEDVDIACRSADEFVSLHLQERRVVAVLDVQE